MLELIVFSTLNGLLYGMLLFLLAMLVALIGEAILCMPSTPKTGSAAA